jgi:tetratricopeptide (TPR) repeat protein
MTLDELKQKYEDMAKTSEEYGNVYNNRGDEKKRKGEYEAAIAYYNLATEKFNEAVIYTKFVNDLNKVTK